MLRMSVAEEAAHMPKRSRKYVVTKIFLRLPSIDHPSVPAFESDVPEAFAAYAITPVLCSQLDGVARDVGGQTPGVYQVVAHHLTGSDGTT